MKRESMILPFVPLLCFVYGCQDNEAIAELEEFRAQAAVEEQNKEIMTRWFEESYKGNLNDIDEFFMTDYVSHWGEISWTWKSTSKLIISYLMHFLILGTRQTAL